MNNLFIFSIVIGLCIGVSNAFHEIGESKVVLSNQLEHSKLLKVHCRSKDDDLGEHILKIGQDYEFTFGDNIWQTTSFSCQMDQGPNFKHHLDFVAYETSWSKALEASCKWIGREDGIYFSQDGVPPTKKYQDGVPPTKKYQWDDPH